MPVYSESCDKCSYRTEKWSSRITEPPAPISCPACIEGKVTRDFAKAGLVFKGSGFYTTDYKRKN
jgi:putative FmdB family regulatory protein